MKCMKIVAIFSISLITSLFLFAIFTISLTTVKNSRNKKAVKNQEFSKYEYIFFDSHDKVTSKSTIELKFPKILDGKEYITYEVSDEKRNGNVMIANFGTSPYHCEGSCFCDDDGNNEERRASVIPLLRGLKYAVGAVSAIVAIEQTKKYFYKSCQDHFSDTCPEHSIRAEVDMCELMEYDLNDDLSGVRMARSFFCKGGCRKGGKMKKHNFFQSNKAIRKLKNVKFDHLQSIIEKKIRKYPLCQKLEFVNHDFVFWSKDILSVAKEHAEDVYFKILDIQCRNRDGVHKHGKRRCRGDRPSVICDLISVGGSSGGNHPSISGREVN